MACPAEEEDTANAEYPWAIKNNFQSINKKILVFINLSTSVLSCLQVLIKDKFLKNSNSDCAVLWLPKY